MADSIVESSWLSKFLVILVWISVVTALENVVIRSANMCYIDRLKGSVKAALRSGKIRRIVVKVDLPDNGIPQAPSEPVECIDWTQFHKDLNDAEWSQFVDHERQFRQKIATRPYESKVLYEHEDPSKWWKVSSIVYRHFVVGGQFSHAKHDGSQFSVNSLKYTMRVLSKFPIEIPELDLIQEDSEYTRLLQDIELALNFISQRIRPSFKRKQGNDQPDDQNSVDKRISKEKLVELWQSNQRRAIDIIVNNDSKDQPPVKCQIDHDRLLQYCVDKTRRALQGELPPPPWQEDFHYDLPDYAMNMDPFTQAEVDKVIKSCKSNTAPGYDGVEYKTLKSHKQSLLDSLTGIVNTCVINRKVPPEWKHSLVVQIPKKNGNPDNPEDWRHISLLLSSYKLYMKLLQSRAMPWIVDTSRLSSKQKGSIPRNGLQEHVLCLKSEIDNLKHTSSKLFITFVDIKDAFGSLDHEYMLYVMHLCDYPDRIIQITKDIYSDSTFQLVTANGLTPKVTRHKGIIQGCP